MTKDQECLTIDALTVRVSKRIAALNYTTMFCKPKPVRITEEDCSTVLMNKERECFFLTKFNLFEFSKFQQDTILIVRKWLGLNFKDCFFKVQ